MKVLVEIRKRLAVASMLGCFTVAALAVPAATAQDRPSPKPSAMTHSLQPLDQIAKTRIDKLDLKKVAEEDAQRDEEALAPRYAIPHEVRITPETHGTWERLDRETMVWRLRITSEDAVSINLGFTRYLMPEGGQLFLYNADQSYVIRPFTAADNAPHGQLWTPPVPTGDIIVELTIPAAQRRHLVLELGSINVGYRGFHEIAMILSGSCNVDVICSVGDDWRDEIPAIGVISTGGSTFCTGFMVNNVRNDLTPYFMTARHCNVTASNAASLVVFWNYENSFCRTPGQSGSGGPGNGSLSQFNTGSIHRAAYSPSDVTLVELTSSPDPSWFISYAGWDATGADALWAVGIHHPRTQEKRISFQNYPTTTTSYLGNPVPGDGTHVRIIDWSLGTTEPGSSGSPLFNQDHRVIGQLHGGYASCTSATSDWYGKFSVSFTGGGTPSTSLRPWLDPDNTGILVVDTISTRGMTISPAGNVVHLGEVGGPFTNDNYEYTLANNTNNDVDYQISLTHNIGILLNGGTGPVSGTLPAGGSSDMLVVSLSPTVSILPPGVYDEVIVFEDFSTGLTREITHTIEVGQTAFTTSPTSAFLASGPLGGPFTATRTYTLTSTKPTAVNITVDSPQPWIAVNGSTNPQSFHLHGIGASVDVEISFSTAADNLPNGLQSGAVVFTNNDGGDGDTTRDVILDVGRLVYYPEDLPQPILDNTMITSTVQVNDEFCIADVEVEMNITHTYIGDLTIDLTSPTGVVVRLHNRTGGSADDIVTTYGIGETLPDGPGVLSDFNDTASQGVWTLTVRDNANLDQGTLNHWALRLAPWPDGDCPSLELVHEFNMDTNPGWSMQGIWQFGQPNGASGGPTSGYTGQNVYATNLTGSYPNNMPVYHLTSGPIDCTGLIGTQLRFMRWLRVESFTFDKASISVSNDGSNWTTLWQHGATLTDTSWNLQLLDISAVADNQPTVYLRWTLGPTDGSVTHAGWYIDDVQIWGVKPADVCPTDLNGDGFTDVSDLLILFANWGACPGCNADINGDGFVDVSDLLLLFAGWGGC